MTSWEVFKKNFYGYTLMLWDGLGFFGTDYMKLGRLKGEKVDFFTRCSSPKDLILLSLTLGVSLYFIFTEIEKLGRMSK